MNNVNLLEASKNWNKKSERQKVQAINKGYKILRRAAQKQLVLLEQQEKDKLHIKSSRHLFIFTIVKSFWENADFAFSLRNKKWNYYAVYPIRTMMEKMLKLSYFLKQSVEYQNDLSDKELLFFGKLIYDFEKSIDSDVTEIIKNYNLLKSLATKRYPNIDKVNIKDLKSFPPYEQLCRDRYKKEYSYY